MEFKRVAFAEPAETLDVQPQPIVRAEVEERFDPPGPSSARHVVSEHGGPSQDGRLAASLGSPMAFRWIPRFEAPLREGSAPTGLLCDADTVLVLGPFLQLYGIDGTPRRVALGGQSAAVLSPIDGTYRYVNRDGFLVARALQDGSERWSCGAPVGGRALYGLHLVHGTASLLGGVHIDENPEHEVSVPHFALEWIDPGEEPEILRGGVLGNARRSHALQGEIDGELLGVTDGQTVVVALEGHLLHLGMDLAVQQVHTGDFTPRAISMGDRGRAYLVVTTADGPALWLINARGERVFSTALPASTTVPPVVAPDHRVFVCTDQEVLAFDPLGALLWRVSSPGGAPRLAVTADGWLLASMGEELRVFDAVGRNAALSVSVGDPFVTAPVLTLTGEILVATQRSLVCLSYEQLTMIS